MARCWPGRKRSLPDTELTAISSPSRTGYIDGIAIPRLLALALQHVLVMYAGAAGVLLTILLLLRYTRGLIQNISVLLGIIAGYTVTIALGWPNFTRLEGQPWLAIIYPFQFGLPKFDRVAGLSMCLVMIVVIIESTGMFLALGDIVERPVTPADLTRGLRADGLGTLIGGMVAATGIKILSGVNDAAQRNNLFVVAISIGFATVAAVSLNAFFNQAGRAEDAKAQAAATAHASEAA